MKAELNKIVDITELNEYVELYGQMSIPEMLEIDKTLKEANMNTDFVKLLDALIEQCVDEFNKVTLTRIRNNFEFFRDMNEV